MDTQKGAFELLMDDITKTLENGEYWKMSSWRDALIIVTKSPDKPELSNNGGDYEYFRIYQSDGLSVHVKDDWSCDFSEYQYSQDEDYNVVISKDGLERMAKLADVTIAAKAWLAKKPESMRRLKAAIRSLE